LQKETKKTKAEYGSTTKYTDDTKGEVSVHAGRLVIPSPAILHRQSSILAAISAGGARILASNWAHHTSPTTKFHLLPVPGKYIA